MKILFDQVSCEYLYPLSKKETEKIKKVIPSEVISKIREIKFGCNTKTTREGRMVQRGNSYSIRVNFCLKNFQSLVLGKNKQYLKEVKDFGGKIDLTSNLITWSIEDAKKYAYYILLHEVAHIIYGEKFLNGDSTIKTSSKEEMWCNNYSKKLVNKLYINLETGTGT